jgi:hypothetical protein
VWEATQNASDGENMPRAAFEELRFSIQDLLGVYPAVARSCGLKWAKAKPNGAGGGESDEGKPIGTG